VKDRLKILDCNRKAVLGVPDSPFKLWMTYYTNEDDEQESWMSIKEIMAQTKMGRRNIIRSTQYLLSHKWLIDTGRTAADKWIAMGKTPTVGSYQIKVYRVDDPTKGLVTNQTPDAEMSLGSNLSPKGSGSGSTSFSGSDFDSIITKPVAPAGKEKRKPKPKPTPGLSGVSANQVKTGKAKTVKLKDGTEVPMPEGFDSWSNADRANFIYGVPNQKEQEAELDKMLMSPNVSITAEEFRAKLNAMPSPEEAAEKVRQMKAAVEKRREASPLVRMLEEA
jgi:hypothetical protein